VFFGPSETHVEVVDVLDDSCPSEGDSDSVMVEKGSEPVSEQGECGTGSRLVSEIGEMGIEPSLIFEEDVDDSFDKVADFEKDEEVKIPILAVQPSTPKVPQPSEGQKKKRIKTPTGRTDHLLFVSLTLCKLKSPLLPHSLNMRNLNPHLNHQESPSVWPHKAFLELSKSLALPNSRALVEEIVSSPESSPIRDSGNTPSEQGSP